MLIGRRGWMSGDWTAALAGLVFTAAAQRPVFPASQRLARGHCDFGLYPTKSVPCWPVGREASGLFELKKITGG
jgi:hypothetical protein